MGANDPQGGAMFDPKVMVGRIYKEDYTLLHTKYEISRPCGFEEEDFYVSHDAPVAEPVCTQGTWFAGFMKRTTIHIATYKI